MCREDGKRAHTVSGHERNGLRIPRGMDVPTKEAPHVLERSDETEVGMRSPKFFEMREYAPLTQSVQVTLEGTLGTVPEVSAPSTSDSMLVREIEPTVGSRL